MIRVLVLALVFLVMFATPALASPERRMLRLINGERAAGLILSGRISRFAERHANQMAQAGSIFHSDMSFPKPVGWREAGENVGVGLTLRSIHRAFMRSLEHRRNILNGVYERVGIGVVASAGRLWVSVEFVG